MTSEEIERTLQLVVGNQARLSEAQIRLGAKQAELDEIIKHVAASHQTLIECIKSLEERIDEHDKWRDSSEEKLASQVKYEVRQDRLEDAFNQVVESHHLIIQLASLHGERLDGHDQANGLTESRFVALIDAQLQLSQSVHALTENIASMGTHLELTVEQVKVNAISQIVDQQALLASKKPARKTSRISKKARHIEQIESPGPENNQPIEPDAGIVGD